MHRKQQTGSSRKKGMSMLEVIISLTLVASIMLISLTASANLMRNRAAAATGVRAERLAGYFLDEISTLDFAESSDEAVFGPESGESASDRRTFDDVDDFHGFRQVSPTFRDGAPISGFEKWTIEGAVSTMTLDGRSLSDSVDQSAPFRLVAITVTDPEGRATTYRSLFSNTSTDRPESQSYERLRRIQLKFDDERTVDLVIPLRNTPEPVYQ